ncbi:MAG: hypothetical protein ABR553_01860 [Gammaproteobacteria bacterium]
MSLSFKKFCLAGALLFAATGVSVADEALKPFTLAYTATGDLQQVTQEVTQKITAAGFEVVGSYSPYDGATVLAITSPALKKAAASSAFGGYAAAQRVSLTQIDEQIQVTYTNPTYYGSAYRLEDSDDLQQAETALAGALGKEQIYGTGNKEIGEDKLRKFRYMIGMPSFSNPNTLAEYANQDAALAAVEAGLEARKGGASKVYRIDIPGKQESVFGVALTEGCSADQYIMSRIDRDSLRSTGHLPYEILVSDGKVYALHGRFRIAISWPHLPMMQSATGATFFSIMCAPGAIEEALTQAAEGGI